MSKIDELIQELCPNGVEHKTLGTISLIKRGERVTKRDIILEGEYPIISGGVTPMGFYDKYNRELNTITISSYGQAGYVDFIKQKFWANDVCLCVFPLEIVNNKFLYFFLKNAQKTFYSNTTKAIPDHIPTQFLMEYEVPVPPMEIQNEIVRILDSFTELTAELTARKKQYEYYRDKLLRFKPLEK